MYDELCHVGNWGFVGGLGEWGWIAPILTLIFWVGLLAALTVVVIWAIRRARAGAAAAAHTPGQATAKEILQDRYARGEISREQYELIKQAIG